MKAYIFLDRDGTINIDKDYLHKPEDFEFEKNAITGLKKLINKGYGLVVITNQSGIGRGMYSIEDANRVHEYMIQELKKYDVEISAVYMCPHGPDDNCECRKPKLGLYEQAIKELDIDIGSSYLIGDRVRDMEPAYKLGCKGALVKTGHFRTEDISAIPQNDIYEDLLDFAENIPAV